MATWQVGLDLDERLDSDCDMALSGGCLKRKLRAAGEALVGVSRTQEQGGWNGLLSPFREQGGWSCLLSASFNGKEARTLSGLLVRLLAYHKIIIAMMTIRSLTEL